MPSQALVSLLSLGIAYEGDCTYRCFSAFTGFGLSAIIRRGRWTAGSIKLVSVPSQALVSLLWWYYGVLERLHSGVSVPSQALVSLLCPLCGKPMRRIQGEPVSVPSQALVSLL